MARRPGPPTAPWSSGCRGGSPPSPGSGAAAGRRGAGGLAHPLHLGPAEVAPQGRRQRRLEGVGADRTVLTGHGHRRQAKRRRWISGEQRGYLHGPYVQICLPCARRRIPVKSAPRAAPASSRQRPSRSRCRSSTATPTWTSRSRRPGSRRAVRLDPVDVADRRGREGRRGPARPGRAWTWRRRGGAPSSPPAHERGAGRGGAAPERGAAAVRSGRGAAGDRGAGRRSRGCAGSARPGWTRSAPATRGGRRRRRASGRTSRSPSGTARR